MKAPPDELRDIERRTAEVERELAETRERIGALVAEPRDRRTRHRFVATVERELRAFDEPTLASEALLEGMHRETGLVGALKTSGERIEWKPFDKHPRSRDVEVSIECGPAPSLQLRSGTLGGARRAMLTFVILTTLLSIGPVSGALGLSLAESGVLALTLLLLVGVAAHRWSVRATKRELRRLGDRLSRRIHANAAPQPLEPARARVSLDEREALEPSTSEALSEAEQAEPELEEASRRPGARRGLP